MKKISLVLILFIVLFGCNDSPVTIDEPPPSKEPPTNIQKVYVLNKGNYNDPFGARLSVYDMTNDTVYYNVFEKANNNLHLGSVGDDLEILHGRLYILMSRSQSLLLIRTSDDKLTQQFYFSTTPHDMVIDSNRSIAYITQFYTRWIYVMDLSSFVMVDSIQVGEKPHGMLIADSLLYVCNSGNGEDSTVSVINMNKDSVISTIGVGYGPNAIARLSDGNIIVSCAGNALSTPPKNGRLTIIDRATNTVSDSVIFNENLFGGIVVDSAGFAFVLGATSGSDYGGPVHRFNPTTHELTMNYINGTYYSITLDETNDDLYLTNVMNFAANGYVAVFRKDGDLRRVFGAQTGPSAIAFQR